MTSFLRPVRKRWPLGIEVSEIAGKKPAVAHDRGSGVGTVPVSLHHDRAAHRDFADGRTFFLRLRIDDLALDALHGLADGSDFIVVRRIGEDGRRGFREAVSLQHVDAEIVESRARSPGSKREPPVTR